MPMAQSMAQVAQVSLKHFHRGPKSTLIFTILRYHGENLVVYNESINVNNIICTVKFFHEKSKCQPCVRMKIKQGVQDGVVPTLVQCGTFKRRFFCSDDWIQVQLNPVPCISSKNINTHYNENIQELFTIEINITTEDIPADKLHMEELYEGDESTDFQLQTSDGFVGVHKAILYLHSTMFAKMLSKEWKESSECRITMDGISVKTLQDLKAYMYLGTLPDEGLEPLLQVAAHYFMDKLIADCSSKLVDRVTADNIDRLVTMACAFNIPGLVRGLLLKTPDEVINAMNASKIEQKADDKNTPVIKE